MVRGAFILVFVFLLLAPNAVQAKEENAGTYRNITAEQAARWILEGDSMRRRLLVHLIREAPADWVEAVLDQVHAKAKSSDASTSSAPTPPIVKETAPLPRMIQIDTRLVEVVPELARKILGDALPTPDAVVRPLPAAKARTLLGLGQGHLEIISAPRLTVIDGQKAEVNVLNQTTYVKDYEVEVVEDKTLVSPVVETIQDGIVVELTARTLDMGAKVAVEGTVTVADLTRPIPTFSTWVGKQHVTIQIPELHVRRVRPDAELPQDGWIVVGGLGEGELGVRLVLIQAHVIDPKDLEGLVAPEVDVTPR